MNPLAEIIAIAKLNQTIWKAHVGDDGEPDLGPEWLVPLPSSTRVEPFPRAHGGGVVFPTVEMAGVAGMYQWLLDQKGLDVIYANDLAYEVHGIDAVARRRGTDTFVLVEAKGTTRPTATPASYLHRTKTRGRQLSWDWCWDATVNLAELPAAAAAFLALVEPMILERVDRMLVVTGVDRSEAGFAVRETRVWDEEALRRYPWLNEQRNWERQRAWLTELKDAS